MFPSDKYSLYCLAHISCYYLILSATWDHTLHCTVRKYYYLCDTIDKLDIFVSRQFDKHFRVLGLVRIFQCPYVPNRWFVTHLYAYLARCAPSKTMAQPKTNPSCVRYTIRRRLSTNLKTYRVGYEVGLNFYKRAERARNNNCFQAINTLYIALHIFPVIT